MHTLDYDVIIVGAGPAGLAAALRRRRLQPAARVCVLEKGAEPGAHQLSGALFDLRDLPEGIAPPPGAVPVRRSSMAWLSRGGAMRCPLPSPSDRVIVSLGRWCRELAAAAEAAGIDVLPGVAVEGAVYDEAGTVIGVSVEGAPLYAGAVWAAEGARGSLSEQLIARFRLRDREPGYALGFKEVWQTPQTVPGEVLHTLGFPLRGDVRGGGFVYHRDDGCVNLGFVVHLDYRDSDLDPYEEFQQFKRHPLIARLLAGGTCLQYGARTIGIGAVERSIFPGGRLIGCAAGTFDPLRRMGIAHALRSGMAAAEDREDPVLQRRLHAVRNFKPLWQRFGLVGAAAGVVDAALGSPFGALRARSDRVLRPSRGPRRYPVPDGVTSFTRADSLYRSGVRHDESRPGHLQLRDPELPTGMHLQRYNEPAQRYCPAGVYAIDRSSGVPRFHMRAGNCLHCKACDSKDPSGNITWTPPRGGDGPGYRDM